MAIAGDTVDDELVAKPLRWNICAIARFSMIFGLISSAFDFLVFAVLLIPFHAGASLFRTGWFLESLLTELAIALVIRTRRPFFRSKPGAVLLWATILVATAAYAMPYLPDAQILGFSPLAWPVVAALTALILLYIFVNEIAKRRFDWERAFSTDSASSPSRGADSFLKWGNEPDD
jgi:Mg2+-importing ATPase